jgi:hypothetical protein
VQGADELRLFWERGLHASVERLLGQQSAWNHDQLRLSLRLAESSLRQTAHGLQGSMP